MYGKENATRRVSDMPFSAGMTRFLANGWDFDKLYNIVFVRPLVWLAKIDEKDFVDGIYRRIGWFNLEMNETFSRSQNGKMRYYLMGIGLGAFIILTLILAL